MASSDVAPNGPEPQPADEADVDVAVRLVDEVEQLAGPIPDGVRAEQRRELVAERLGVTSPATETS